MKKSLILASAVALLAATAPARTWTSADGSKTFDGELRSYNATTGTVTVLVNGRVMTFTQDKLSAGDIAYLENWEKEKNALSPAEMAAESVVGQKVTKAKLHRLDGKRYRRAELDKAPEYYILYYSASW